MRRKTKREMVIKKAKKAARSAIRLKYSLMAEEELNEKLPEIEAQVNRAFAEGREFTLDVSDLYELEE